MVKTYKPHEDQKVIYKKNKKKVWKIKKKENGKKVKNVFFNRRWNKIV